MPPLCRETSVSRTANVGTVGKHLLIGGGLFIYSHCGETFSKKWKLNVHEKMHEDEKHLVSCNVCNKVHTSLVCTLLDHWTEKGREITGIYNTSKKSTHGAFKNSLMVLISIFLFEKRRCCAATSPSRNKSQKVFFFKFFFPQKTQKVFFSSSKRFFFLKRCCAATLH